MKHKISRRKFITQSTLVAGATLFSGCDFTYRPHHTQTNSTSTIYPPALTGLRGDADGNQAAAHSVALGKQQYTLPKKAIETYDLIVIGAGISGLASAWYYQRKHPQAKILILDNHEDFGGHAIRNEFNINGRTIITYGGSESIDSPATAYSTHAQQFLKDLGIDYTKFEQYFDKNLYSKKWQLTSGIFLNKATFGESKLIVGKPSIDNSIKENAKIIKQFPFTPTEQELLITLYNAPQNYWQHKSNRQKQELAENTSYLDFLKNIVSLPTNCLNYLHNISSEYWGHDISAISVLEAIENGYPGVQNLGIKIEEHEEEPYIYHFPDGNASIARMLVRKLIPSIATGDTMEDIVTAQFNYSKLDTPEQNVRIRLKSTALIVENTPQGVAVTYLPQPDKHTSKQRINLIRIDAKHVIYAGHAALAARIMPEMRQTQQQAMLSNVKVPMVYAKVAVKNAQFFKKVGIYEFYNPYAPYCFLQLDYPVNIGDYQAPQEPDGPILIHAVRIATSDEGKTAREKYRLGRKQLAKQNADELKTELINFLRELYATAGENFDEVYVDSTINRWAHGYSYEAVGLFDSKQGEKQTTKQMQQAIGNIHIANSDATWQPYLQGAIDQAYRAVNEIS